MKLEIVVMFKRIDKEILFGGIFGILAVLATVFELIANGISLATVWGAIKDISGTIVAVMVFIVAVKHWFVKKPKDFNAVFSAEMEQVIKKYSPIIEEDKNIAGRYNIASNLDSIIGKETGAFHTLFEVNGRKEIHFNVTKTVFKGRSVESFDEMQRSISLGIGSKIKDSFDIVEKFELTPKGIKIIFKEELKTCEDAMQLAEIVDYTLLLYFVEYKK